MFHARDGAIFSKNSTFVFFDGASPITENGIQLRSPSPIMAPARVYYVTTKISWIDRLPNLLSNGAPLVRYARRLGYKEPK